MKVTIKVTPLIALEPFDVEFGGNDTLGQIHGEIARRVAFHVREYNTSQRTAFTAKWHESHTRVETDNEQDFIFSALDDNK